MVGPAIRCEYELPLPSNVVRALEFNGLSIDLYRIPKADVLTRSRNRFVINALRNKSSVLTILVEQEFGFREEIVVSETPEILEDIEGKLRPMQFFE